MKRRIAFLCSAFAGVASLTSCIPWPERLRDTPDISGRITTSGVPAAGLQLSIIPRGVGTSRPTACERSPVPMRTDANGNFQAAAHFTSYFPTILIGESPEWRADWALCVADDSTNPRGRWRILHTDVTSLWEPVHLECDTRRDSEPCTVEPKFTSAEMK